MRSALDACGNNVSAAARRLGISRSTLYRRVLATKSSDGLSAGEAQRAGLVGGGTMTVIVHVPRVACYIRSFTETLVIGTCATLAAARAAITLLPARRALEVAAASNLASTQQVRLSDVNAYAASVETPFASSRSISVSQRRGAKPTTSRTKAPSNPPIPEYHFSQSYWRHYPDLIPVVFLQKVDACICRRRDYPLSVRPAGDWWQSSGGN